MGLAPTVQVGTPLTVTGVDGDQLRCRGIGGGWKLPGNPSRDCRLTTGRGSTPLLGWTGSQRPGIFGVRAGEEQKDVFRQPPQVGPPYRVARP